MPESVVRLRTNFTHRGVRLLLAALLAFGMTVVASVATQQPAHAAGCAAGPDGFFPVGTCFTVKVAHKCELIGLLPNGNEADVCVDIHTTWTPSTYEIWGTGEYYCQGGSTQCKGIHANNTLLISTAVLHNKPFQCSTTACPDGGRAMVSTPHFTGVLVGRACVIVSSVVTTDAAILVNGTSTAFHPRDDLVVTKALCYSV